MCMVEVEGIPKLQTSCSTPVKDGMVVYTQTDRVKHAQNAVVEFLLVNHPLDCPVCDKGGECPLQDISYGWGPGRSRFVEDKRNFPKPIALSPLIAIDRERCILCYRCVRFSQEVAEDDQLVFLERARPHLRGHLRRASLRGAVLGERDRAVPGRARSPTPPTASARGRGTSRARARSATSARASATSSSRSATSASSACCARDNHDVDDGWLCDKGRWGYQSMRPEERVTQPLVRDGGMLRPATWEHALDAAAAGLAQGRLRVTAALVGGQTTNEEG